MESEKANHNAMICSATARGRASDPSRPSDDYPEQTTKLNKAGGNHERIMCMWVHHVHAHDAWHETLATNSLTWDLGARAERVPATRQPGERTDHVCRRTYSYQ